MRYLIRNAKIVNEGTIRQGNVLVENGRIADIAFTDGEEKSAMGSVWALSATLLHSGSQIIEAEGSYLLPGVIDTHVHFRDGGDGENPAGDMATESRAALMGGVTSVIDMPNTNPTTTTLEALEQKEEAAAAKMAVNYGFMVGATNDNIDMLLGLSPDRYAAVKLFLGSSTGNMLVNDEAELERLFQESRKLIVAHCEEEAVVQANLRTFRAEFEGTEKETAALHPQIRNTEACYLSTYKAVERARRHGTRLHIAHISTATELDLLSNKALDEKNITAEVTPNHLWFDDRDYDTLGNFIKCNPAIKSNNDRLALWAGLFDGLIDTIATDHAPHPLAAKQKPYFQAPSGIPSIQHSLLTMLEGVFHNTADDYDEVLNTWLPLIVEKMCHNPATIFGIQDRGFIRKGDYADLVLVRPDEQGREVTRKSLLYKCGWSPLEGATFHTEITHVLVNGKLAMAGGELLDTTAAKKLQYTK